MSNFWSWYVIGLVVVSILACSWLLFWTRKQSPEDTKDDEALHHDFDGIRELNTPLPRWWLWLFWICIVVSVGYLVIYPGLGNFKGSQGWTSQNQWEAEKAEAKAQYEPLYQQLGSQSIEALAENEQAQAIGARLFANHCSTCHGADARGAPGFPNLRGSNWLYGNSPETIEQTILKGRNGVMPAWEPVVGADGVAQLAQYVLQLAGRQDHDPTLAQLGKARYESLCAACHMPNGTGNQAIGAPNLTKNKWLYGGDLATITESIAKGRAGKMPAHEALLGKDRVRILAAYIYRISKESNPAKIEQPK